MTQEGNAAEYALLSQAIALEPSNGVILAQALFCLTHRNVAGWPPLTSDDKATCRDLVRRALANARGDAWVLAQCGNSLIHVTREYDLGLATISRAVAANPNNVDVMLGAGIGNAHCGNLDDALTYFNRVLRLSPADPSNFITLIGIALVQMTLGKYAEALAVAERSLAVNANFDPTYWMLISANAQLGRMEEARRWLAKFREISPGITIAKIRDGQPAKDPSRMAAILEGLRLAGLDEG